MPQSERRNQNPNLRGRRTTGARKSRRADPEEEQQRRRLQGSAQTGSRDLDPHRGREGARRAQRRQEGKEGEGGLLGELARSERALWLADDDGKEKKMKAKAIFVGGERRAGRRGGIKENCLLLFELPTQQRVAAAAAAQEPFGDTRMEREGYRKTETRRLGGPLAHWRGS